MSESDASRNSDLIPEDHAEAMRRFEAVRSLDPTAVEALEKGDLLLAGWSFCWLEASLHPDDVKVWPEDFSEALPLAAARLVRSRTPSSTASCTNVSRVPNLYPHNTKKADTSET